MKKIILIILMFIGYTANAQLQLNHWITTKLLDKTYKAPIDSGKTIVEEIPRHSVESNEKDSIVYHIEIISTDNAYKLVDDINTSWVRYWYTPNQKYAAYDSVFISSPTTYDRTFKYWASAPYLNYSFKLYMTPTKKLTKDIRIVVWQFKKLN